MQGLLFVRPVPQGENTLLLDNLLHNRFNVALYAGSRWVLRTEMRNRLFYGEGVKYTPGYAEQIENVHNDIWDLSFVWWNHSAVVGHSMLDRLYLEYFDEKWEVRIGRQRINWGIGTVWNPNDIFNAFAFTDFDYEERPGSDAIRIKRYLGFASSMELAMRVTTRKEDAVAALCYKFNAGTSDIQFLAGVIREEWVAGVGWASNLGDAGFKGEATAFLPMESEKKNSLAITMGVDYSFSGGWYVQAGGLYNSNGSLDRSVGDLFNFELSAKNLYPYRFAFFSQVSYPVNPLTRIGLATIYSPVKAHALFLNPVATFSVASDWDLDLVGQVVFNKEQRYRSPLQAFFIRFKWSF